MTSDHATTSDHAADIDKHVRVYITVFVALMVLTLVTVAISRLHLSVPIAVTVALLVATVKGTLVACYFMHLISEKKLIYAVLALTVVFFIVLLAVPIFTTPHSYLRTEVILNGRWYFPRYSRGQFAQVKSWASKQATPSAPNSISQVLPSGSLFADNPELPSHGCGCAGSSNV